MPVPSPRNKILPARGDYADLLAGVASILNGEICYAIDQDQYYQNEGGTLVAVGATKVQGALADSAVQPGDNVSTLANDAAYITSAGAPVQSVASKTGVVTLIKGDVGLGNVDNTSDANKPISTATQSALDLKADLVGGVIPNSQLPSLAISEYLGTVADQTALLALSGQRGDWAIRTDTGSTWVITTDGGSLISDWTELATPADAVSSVNGFTGTVVLGASDVGAATSAQGTLADSAVQPGDNVSTLTNDAGYIGEAPQDGTQYVRNNAAWEAVDVPPGTVVSNIAPTTPASGQLWYDTEDARIFVWTGTEWADASPDAGNPVVITSDTAPSAPQDGDLWFRTTDGRMYVYYDDGASSQWVDANPSNSASYWARTGTTLSPVNAADDIDLGTGDLTATAGTFAGTVKPAAERTITAGAFDLSTGNHWTCGAITVPAPTNATASTSGVIRITAAPVGWNAVFKFPGGTVPTIASFPALIPFYVESGSVILMGNVAEGIA